VNSGKHRTEKEIADLFLDLYNNQTGSQFHIEELRDIPDVTCIDLVTNQKLELEITFFEDFDGIIPYLKGVKQQPVSRTLNTTTHSFSDVVNNLIVSLKKKMQSAYGSHTALVLYQVSNLWEPKEWMIVADLLKDSIKGKEGCYGAGVWLICRENLAHSSQRALFRII
jgi:hypothetical protein